MFAGRLALEWIAAATAPGVLQVEYLPQTSKVTSERVFAGKREDGKNLDKEKLSHFILASNLLINSLCTILMFYFQRRLCKTET